ncbi:hypothetical protein O5833_28190, partial [Escherichia coli]|nr:hypothetical protein [Escherichia coli]
PLLRVLALISTAPILSERSVTSPPASSLALGERWSDWKPAAGQTWHSFNDYINFSDKTGKIKNNGWHYFSPHRFMPVMITLKCIR